ncbi:SDR family oxidoreductase [Limosilactobacillus fermentum]|uniref:SDR family oxidoreductase n=1 Tax=Limosilactobacillus fermentum TaxID=1613 RepID=UPI001CA6AB0C|nr:SDR family oxidoreductase [Limosilactobacillus fermentum]QZY76400.1 SDR family NAD(P)-dependent oxidoreductase [Limosilactobacillus fermentum]
MGQKRPLFYLPGGTKVLIATGLAAMARLKAAHQQLKEVATALSTTPEEVVAAASDLLAKNKALKKQLKAATKALMAQQAAQVLASGQQVNKVHIESAGDISVLAPLVLKGAGEETLLWAKLQAVVDEIKAAGGQASYRTVDVTDLQSVKDLVAAAQAEFGGLDVIYNNAGIMPNSPMSEVWVDEWNAMIEIDLKGVLNGIAAVLPVFKAQKHGHIIATSSVAGVKNYVGSGVYGAAKWGVRNAMEVTRMESANEGTNIRYTTLCPAAIDTELLDHIGFETTAANMKAFYKQHALSPEAIARVVNIAVDQPAEVDISEVIIYPTNQA